MIPRAIAKRYAKALFDSALKANIAERIHEEGVGFRRILQDKPEFRNFLLSPEVLNEAKLDIIRTSLEGRASDLFVRFLVLLIERQRFPFVEEMLEAYHELYEKHEGIIEVRVITAIPLDETMRQKTQKKLESGTGKKIVLLPEVDPEILGGMILIMEERIFDGSIRHHLEKFRRNLAELRVG
jgi:F-type H+-transporting ATPase subunit delta